MARLLLCSFLALSAVIAAEGGSSYLDSYLSDEFIKPDSDEHGVSKGTSDPSCPCGWSNKEGTRIVGGKPTQINEYPHMVAMAKMDYMGRLRFFCGGSIITTRHVITAAHCTTSGMHNLFIVAGEHNKATMFETWHTKKYAVKEIIPHPEYNTTNHVHDIAILVTDKMAFSQAIGPVCLPKKRVNLDYEYVKVTGWGHTEWKGQASDVLNKVHLKVYPIALCAAKYPFSRINTRNPTQFCTYGPSMDSCQGDSGGPVTWVSRDTNRYVLAGVVSYGMECASTTPGVNTLVHAYMDWIDSVTRSHPDNVSTCF